MPKYNVALHPEGVDRNTDVCEGAPTLYASPSTRRAWIEIDRLDMSKLSRYASPSTRRAWIEIVEQDYDTEKNPSPSTRRAWIEI